LPQLRADSLVYGGGTGGLDASGAISRLWTPALRGVFAVGITYHFGITAEPGHYRPLLAVVTAAILAVGHFGRIFGLLPPAAEHLASTGGIAGAGGVVIFALGNAVS